MRRLALATAVLSAGALTFHAQSPSVPTSSINPISGRAPRVAAGTHGLARLQRSPAPLPPPIYARPAELSTADERLDRLETWLHAVERHRPGVPDTHRTEV